jgi:hypothetical protein
MGRSWASFGCDAPRTTATVTEQDYGAFFHQFFSFTNNPALAPFANAQCPCQRYLMGGDGAWDHINSCIYHSANWTTAHEHVLQAFEHVCNDAGFATRRKHVLTSEGSRRADLEIATLTTLATVGPSKVIGGEVWGRPAARGRDVATSCGGGATHRYSLSTRQAMMHGCGRRRRRGDGKTSPCEPRSQELQSSHRLACWRGRKSDARIHHGYVPM